jgi:hypothetical protein
LMTLVPSIVHQCVSRSSGKLAVLASDEHARELDNAR